MRRSKLLLALFILISGHQLNAQVVSNVKPPETGKMGEYTEWKKVDVSFDDGGSASIDYRIALVDRKGIGCHYNIEVKNNSEMKLKVKLKSSYYDKFVKSNFGDESKESLKPGKTIAVRFVAQGCKKEKGVERDDYGHCIACEFGIDIYVSKD